MKIENPDQLKKVIQNAIEDHKITREEYDHIIHAATKDGHIDPLEQALLAELQQMLQDGFVKFRKA